MRVLTPMDGKAVLRVCVNRSFGKSSGVFSARVGGLGLELEVHWVCRHTLPPTSWVSCIARAKWGPNKHSQPIQIYSTY